VQPEDAPTREDGGGGDGQDERGTETLTLASSPGIHERYLARTMHQEGLAAVEERGEAGSKSFEQLIEKQEEKGGPAQLAVPERHEGTASTTRGAEERACAFDRAQRAPRGATPREAPPEGTLCAQRACARVRRRPTRG
jgi:hypothetical protein